MRQRGIRTITGITAEAGGLYGYNDLQRAGINAPPSAAVGEMGGGAQRWLSRTHAAVVPEIDTPEIETPEIETRARGVGVPRRVRPGGVALIVAGTR